MSGHVHEKVKEEIKRQLSEVLAQARDPRLGFITLMDLKLSPDLRYATAYISVLDEAREEETIELLQRHRGFFRSELAKRLPFRRTPALTFALDEVEKRARRIDELLREGPA